MATWSFALLWLSLINFIYATGTCYYAANQETDPSIVPCVSAEGSFTSCCQQGDICLDDSACWNAQYDVTYFYGCTDPSYESAVCPFKCGSDYDQAPYVGLELCGTTDSWSCTHPPDHGSAIQPNSPNCGDSSNVAYEGFFVPVVQLPGSADGQKVFFSEINPTSYVTVPGYTPTGVLDIAATPTPIQVTTSEGLSGQTTTAQTTSAASTPSEVSSSSVGSSTTSGLAEPAQSTTSTATPAVVQHKTDLGKGAEAGIGVGVVLLLLIVGVIVFLWLRKRRQRRRFNQPSNYVYNAGTAYKPAELAGATVIDGSQNEKDFKDSGTSTLRGSWSYGKPAGQGHYRDLSGSTSSPHLSYGNSPELDSTPLQTSPAAGPFDRWSRHVSSYQAYHPVAVTPPTHSSHEMP